MQLLGAWPIELTMDFIESKRIHLSYLGRDFDVSTIRRYLKLADGSYTGTPVTYYCAQSDKDLHGSMLFVLNQLELDGHIKADWRKSTDTSGEPQLQLLQLSRTPKGHEYLEALNRKAWPSKIKKRLIDMALAVGTALLTTLTTLWLAGK